MSEECSRPSGLGMSFLLGGVLVVLISVLSFLPIFKCRFHSTQQLPAGRSAIEYCEKDGIEVDCLLMKGDEVVAGSCSCCGVKGRISLYRRLTFRPHVGTPF